MSALNEAEKALNEFVGKNVSCATCKFFEIELFGGKCLYPELEIRFIESNTSMCECHEFKDSLLEKQLNGLQEIWINAWYIVEGFLYGQLSGNIFR